MKKQAPKKKKKVSKPAPKKAAAKKRVVKKQPPKVTLDFTLLGEVMQKMEAISSQLKNPPGVGVITNEELALSIDEMKAAIKTFTEQK